MPLLDWKEHSVRLDVTVLSEVKNQLTVYFQKQEKVSLISHLEETFVQNSGELRWILPQNWVLFLKLREEGNRALMAHPQAQEWVGTIALESECAKKVLQQLVDLEPGESISLNQLGSFGAFCNLELVLFLES